MATDCTDTDISNQYHFKKNTGLVTDDATQYTLHSLIKKLDHENPLIYCMSKHTPH